MVDPDAEDLQPRKRPVPSPSGKLAPHTIRGVEGETAQTWTKKFLTFLAKAENQAELDQWDEMNGKFIDLVQERDADSYNSIVDAMNAKAAAFQPKPEQPSDGFPGDKSAPKKADPISSGPDPLDIPAALRRAPAKPALTDNERDWLESLSEAFAQCNTGEELAAEQESMMLPAKDTVSIAAWKAAIGVVSLNEKRIHG